jgi:hypothetical protein
MEGPANSEITFVEAQGTLNYDTAKKPFNPYDN